MEFNWKHPVKEKKRNVKKKSQQRCYSFYDGGNRNRKIKKKEKIKII